MKYSYNWLKEISDTHKGPRELAEMIGSKGFEFEGQSNLADDFEKIVVAEVVKKKKHPQADRLWLVVVKDGKKERKIVCGANNYEISDKVPLALPGAVLPFSKIQISQRVVRGEISEGMLCAEDELGLGKNHDGIMILDKKLKTGQTLAEALGLNDVVLEFDILPNRAHDCLCHLGMAREICSMEGKKLKEEKRALKKLKFSKKGKKINVAIKERELCPRYIGVLLENIKIDKSPRWMQNRLLAAGMEPINNVVDITNYVMLKIGNPLHAFDAKMVAKGAGTMNEIVVRKAKRGESMNLLDGTKIELEERDLVIADREKILALAGIKGGKNSGINKETNKVILEAANFDSFNIRRTRQRLGLFTESQVRFEKKISPSLAQKAAQEAVFLLKKYAGARVIEAVDANFSKKTKREVFLEFDYLENLLGEKIDKRKAIKILQNLGFDVLQKKSKKIKVLIPKERLDVENQEDLIEEIGRIHGYEKIKAKPFNADVIAPRQNYQREFEWRVKDLLAALGFFEAVNYSFYGREEKEKFSIKGNHLELANPLSQEMILMRKTLIPGLLGIYSQNIRKRKELAFFEVGKVFGNYENSFEKLKVAGIFGTRGKSAENNFEEIKKRMVGFFEELGITFNYKGGILELDSCQNEPSSDLFLDKEFSVVIKEKEGGTILGRMGKISKLARDNQKKNSKKSNNRLYPFDNRLEKRSDFISSYWISGGDCGGRNRRNIRKVRSRAKKLLKIKFGKINLKIKKEN